MSAPMDRTYWKTVLGIAALVATAPVTLGLTGVDQTDLACEDAIEHARDCCPDLEPTDVACDGTGCSTSDLDLATSQCLDAMSCDDMQKLGTCKALKELRSPDGGVELDAGAARQEICR